MRPVYLSKGAYERTVKLQASLGAKSVPDTIRIALRFLEASVDVQEKGGTIIWVRDGETLQVQIKDLVKAESE